MALVNKTMNTEYAAFSKSVSWTSMLRNSTLHPMGESTGGGLNRIVCQFVDWMFSKWSIDVSSSWSTRSLKTTSGSRMNR